MTKNEAIQKVLTIAENEVGYLEKKNGNNLDHKTANAGSANYTKYGYEMHNLYPKVMDYPAAWCCAFVSWILYKAFGMDKAKQLMCGDIDDYTVAAAARYKNKKRYFKTPEIGDQIFFKNALRICHTGIVYKVDSTKVYTIEGNTSSGAAVIENGGGVFKKSYLLSNARIDGYGRPDWSCVSSEANTGNPSSASGSSMKVLETILDVSKYNTVDFAKAAGGYPGVMIRVGYRSYAKGELTLDPKFVDHAKNALAAGMKIGVYFYDQSLNESEAIQQADFVIGLIKALPISYPVFIDSEYSNANHNGRADSLSKDVRTKNIIAFCERIKSCGYQAGVYASDSWFKSMVDFGKLKEYEIWCARYSDSAPTIPKYDIWQCGSQIVPGSSSAVDINKVYKKYSNNTKTPSSPEDNSYCYCRVNVKTSLNVRNKPSLSGKVIGHLTGGLAINVTTLDNGWCKISSDEQWCSYKYIAPTKGTVVNCNLLNFRSESNTSSKILKTLKCGEKLNILSKTGNWYYAEKDGIAGYVSCSYIITT